MGRTPLNLFDALDVQAPAWLQAGDQVRWFAVNRAPRVGNRQACGPGQDAELQSPAASKHPHATRPLREPCAPSAST